MTAVRDAVMAKLHRQRDPWQGIGIEAGPVQIQGWNSSHQWLGETIAEIRPQIVVEIGVWKGASVAMMANQMRDLDINGVVIAVDTWLGSSEHWSSEEWANDIPTLYHQFLTNIAAAGLTDYVVPLRLDSLNAARLLRTHLRPDMIHLDGGHDYHSVHADLHAWWPLLPVGGVFIGDDYWPNGQWPEVRQAIDDFLPTVGVTSWEALAGKCRVRKS